MAYTDKDLTIALAGIFQAAQLVQHVARSGLCDANAMEASIQSLFATDPPDTESVFGGLANLETGLRLVKVQLATHTRERDLEITKYVIALLHLERKLSKNPEMLQKISDGIDRARQQTEHFHVTHPNVIANLADLYTNTLSTMLPRILVNGDPVHLNNPDVANKIRALLMAGIRAAVLWRQCGGGRFTLMFKRGKLVDHATALLKTIAH